MAKHRDKMQQDLVLRGFAKATCEGYLRCARAFVAHFGRSADELGSEQVRSWVLWLLTVKKRDAATVNVAIAALRHLFASLGRPDVMLGIRGVRKQYREPDVLSGSEVERLLQASVEAASAALTTAYTGLDLLLARCSSATTAVTTISAPLSHACYGRAISP